MPKIKDNWHYRPHPRSALKPLEDPFLDPRDGRGAYSSDHIMQLREYQDAMRGDPKALASALKRATRRSKRELKLAKGRNQHAWQRAQEDWPSPLPVMELLGMVKVIHPQMPPDPADPTSKYRRVQPSEWLKEVVGTHSKSSLRAKAALEDWLARDCVDLRQRSEESRMT